MIKKIDVQILKNSDLTKPKYETSHSAGVDVRSISKEDIVIKPGGTALIKTGIKIAIPDGFEVQVRPRSGLAYKNQVTVINAPGTIDGDFRGDIGVILINHGLSDFTVKHGDRIAQFILAPFYQINWVEVDELSETDRGEGGFGHTGIK